MSQEATSLESRHEVERRFHDERMAGRQADDRDFYAVGGMDLVLDAYHEAIPRRMARSTSPVEVAFTAATPA